MIWLRSLIVDMREGGCFGTIFIHLKYVLLSLVNKAADWPMVRQDLGSRENTGKKKDGVSGVESEMQGKEEMGMLC